MGYSVTRLVLEKGGFLPGWVSKGCSVTRVVLREGWSLTRVVFHLAVH